jgi:DNA invertase Pin-like site-specific DNA recombinase
MARFAIYLRRSSPGDEDKNYSIEAQEHDIEARWTEYSQHEQVARYSDPGGRSYTLARPVLQAMMVDARARKFDILLVGRWDRFSRIQEQ